MKYSVIYLRITGSICLLFTLFHFGFSSLFNWNESLSCLSQSDRAIMMTYHYASILISGFMTLVLLFQTRKLLESTLKKSILGLFTAFFSIRIITEFTHFGFRIPHSLPVVILCAIPVVIFIITLSHKKSSL